MSHVSPLLCVTATTAPLSQRLASRSQEKRSHSHIRSRHPLSDKYTTHTVISAPPSSMWLYPRSSLFYPPFTSNIKSYFCLNWISFIFVPASSFVQWRGNDDSLSSCVCRPLPLNPSKTSERVTLFRRHHLMAKNWHNISDKFLFLKTCSSPLAQQKHLTAFQLRSKVSFY